MMKIAPTLISPSLIQSSQSVSKTESTVGVSSEKPPLDPDRVREVTFIGVGSSIAYALNELNSRHSGAEADAPLHSKVTIIGQQDAWKPEVRGTGYINHQHQIIDQWGDHAPKYDPTYADRGEFSASNDAQIKQSLDLGAEHLKQGITGITRNTEGEFIIALDNGKSVKSKQVVLGMGAGPHSSIWGESTDPTATEKRFDNITLNDKPALHKGGTVMDLDEFMRASDTDPDRFKGKHIVVHGPNAGIDAVERAGELGAAKVDWMIRSTKPVLLDGNQLKYAPATAKDHLVSVDKLNITPKEDGGVVLEFSEPVARNADPSTAKKGKIEADFYVYALGQDPDKPGTVGHVLKNLIRDHELERKLERKLELELEPERKLELKHELERERNKLELEPAYDMDQVYSDKPYETVLGLQTEGSGNGNGLLVVGASVNSLAPRVAHNYLDKATTRIHETTHSLGLTQADTLDAAVQSKASREEITQKLAAVRVALGEAPEPHALASFQVLANQVRDFLDARDHLSNPKNSVAAAVENQVKTEVASVVVSPQLGTVKASSAGLTGHMPGYIANGEVNYTSDNRTMLRAHIANEFDNITNEQASQFIEEAIEIRRKTGSEFVATATDRVMNGEILPLLKNNPEGKGLEALAKLGVKPATTETLLAFVKAGKDAESSEGVSLVEQIRQEVSAHFQSQPKPVLGTPEKVTDGYESELARLDQGGGNTTLTKHWA
ncbi:restriction endonuclease [Parachitinimonas caeni]|uniref:Restriction endonuclease n=1 Tax=Parachitinimonas caeni TaxID=3031301 RepID=A0ABT7E0G1_9NEIS|nr:restriction endonuclease [Parachitinimonas caeni]MDK2125771.1 restriction endonuclease [Parachitinimonas caeni]